MWHATHSHTRKNATQEGGAISSVEQDCTPTIGRPHQPILEIELGPGQASWSTGEVPNPHSDKVQRSVSPSSSH